MKIKKSGGPDDEAKFASMLESYHEALLDGGARSFNEARDDEPVDPELVRARRCVRMLEELRCTSEDTRTAYASLFHDLPGADEWTDDKTPSELGRFQILEQLGRGGQGIIYRALDPVLDREVALKIPRPSAVVSHDLRRRFLQEARAVALLNHPHLIPVHDVGFAGPICYIASAYCRGETLEKWLREQKDLPSFHAAADLVSVLAETVNYVHRQGILHRDLKPSNVLLEQPSTASLQSGPWPNELSTFTPRLTDFGLAKLLHAPAGETATGTFLGTPAYMAPEQAEARRHDIGPPTDVYALGVMLYELLVGRPPFRGQSPLETLRQINEGNFTAPRRARRTVPRDLEAICLKCMELRPADRYQTASDLAADLKRFLSRRPVTARPVTPIARLVKWSRRKPLVAALGVLLMFSTFCGLAGVTWQWRRAQVLGEQSRVRLVRQYVDRGVAALERGDYAGSLPWLLEALTWEKPDSTSAHAQLFRIGAVLQRCPRLTQFLYHDVSLKFAEFSVDGRFVAVAALDAYGRIWDAKSGKLLGAPLAHGDYVLCARIDSSGEWAMTCGTNNVARIWNLASGQPACPPLEHPSGVIWAEFSPSGKLVVTTSNSGAVRVWSVPAGQAVTGWLSHEARVECATFSSDEKLVATACSDGKARIWDIASSRALITATHQGAVHSVELTGDDQLMLTGGDDFAARIWHVGTGQQVTPPLRHEMIVNSAHFSSNDRLIVTASSDHSARVWDSKTGSPISPPLVHGSAVYHAQFSPDSRLVVTASWDHTARVWEAKTGRPITPPLMHAHFVVRASFSPDGMNVLTCSVDGAARIWQLPTENTDVRVLPHNSAVREAVFQPHSHHVLTLDASGNVHVWDGTRGHEFTSCLDRGEPVTRMAINRDGSKVAMAHGNRVSVWDMPTKSSDMPKKSMSIGALIEDGPIDQIGFSAGGDRLMTVTGAAAALVWDTATGDLIGPGIRSAIPIHHAEFSPDGSRLVLATGSAGGKGAGQVWSIDRGAAITAPLTHARMVVHACFSPDGTQVLTTCSDPSFSSREANLWDATTGAPVAPPLRHLDGVCFATFSPDGRRVVTCSADRTARIWDARSGEAICPPMEHRRGVLLAAFCPQGRMVATASLDGQVRLWEVNTGQLLAPPLLHGDTVNSINFSSDGAFLLTASDDGTAKSWRLPWNRISLADLRRKSAVLSAHRIDQTGALVPVDITELHDAWKNSRAAGLHSPNKWSPHYPASF